MSFAVKSPKVIYMMAYPSATLEEFIKDTGGNEKDFENCVYRQRTKDSLTFKELGIRVPHSKGIVYMMVHSRSTKEEYVKAGFPEQQFYKHCIRARELLIAINAANTLVFDLEKTIGNRMYFSEPDEPAQVELPLEEKPKIVKQLQVDKHEDVFDVLSEVNLVMTKLVSKVTEKDSEIGMYRSRITALNAENFRLRSEVSELTEMINGPRT